MASTEAQKRASAKYQREKTKQVNLKFSPNEMDMYRWLTERDGTASGTTMVAEIRAGGTLFGSAASFAAFGNRLVFPADDGKSGMELWISDGTAEGTMLLVDADGSPASSRPSILYVGTDTLWFRAETGRGSEPWWTDGRATTAPQGKSGGCAVGMSPLLPALFLPLIAMLRKRR